MWITTARFARRRWPTRSSRAASDRGLLQGVPYALKDIVDAAGMATTCQSRLRLNHVAPADATVVARLRDAGAVLLGKLATFEFALGGRASTCVPANPESVGPQAHGGRLFIGLRRGDRGRLRAARGSAPAPRDPSVGRQPGAARSG